MCTWTLIEQDTIRKRIQRTSCLYRRLKMDEKSGWGFVIKHGKRLSYTTRCGYLGINTSVYQAKLEAVWHAASYLYGPYYGSKIICPCRNTVKTLECVQALLSSDVNEPFFTEPEQARAFKQFCRANPNLLSLTELETPSASRAGA